MRKPRRCVEYSNTQHGGMEASAAMKIGSMRISTHDQNAALQQDALAAAECEQVFSDTASGAKAARPGHLQRLSWARTADGCHASAVE